jgi:pimeloyl-ACP methyl ester carboxylesterase
VHVERYGKGSTAYLGLHGWGSDHKVFAPLAARVPRDASFYAADLPGCGLSDLPSEWTVDAILAEILDTAQSLQSGRVTIVGHCGGAAFGMLMAGDEPKLIERVVAIDPFAYLPGYFRIFTGERFGRRAYKATFANPVGRWVTNRTLNVRSDRTRDFAASFGDTNHEVALHYLHIFEALGGVDAVRHVHAPVDLVYGERTFGAVKKSIAQLGNALPHARTIRLSSAHHLPLEEATDQLAQIIFGPGKVAMEVHAKDEKVASIEENGVKI